MKGNGAHHPGYVSLLESGELERRAAAAVGRLKECDICPRHCGADRLRNETGTCRTGRHARVACSFPHLGEESCLRGWRGSGTIFFCGCNLLCPFCQNWDTSHGCEGRLVSTRRLAELMLELERAGCHNINWVTPTHVVPQALEALAVAARAGLRLPLVYNTGGYDALESLALLDGVVDIYMPDYKFWDPAVSRRFLGLEDYPEVARRALKEMHRQVGDLVLDEQGIARRGLLVRHLVLPGGLAGTAELSRWIASELSPSTFVNIMAQYHPAGAVLSPSAFESHMDIARPITSREHREALDAARRAGLHRFDAG